MESLRVISRRFSVVQLQLNINKGLHMVVLYPRLRLSSANDGYNSVCGLECYGGFWRNPVFLMPCSPGLPHMGYVLLTSRSPPPLLQIYLFILIMKSQYILEKINTEFFPESLFYTARVHLTWKYKVHNVPITTFAPDMKLQWKFPHPSHRSDAKWPSSFM